MATYQYRKVGSGGFGTVYVNKVNNATALKCVKDDRDLQQELYMNQKVVTFMSEADVKTYTTLTSTSSLLRTVPNIELEDKDLLLDKRGTSGCYAMQFCNGQEMFNAVNSKTTTPATILKCMKQLLDKGTGLIHFFAKLHENGIYHRDIKLENLMVNCQGQMKVIDFGLSCTKSKNEDFFKKLKMTGITSLMQQYVGTGVYMAPVCIYNSGARKQTDKYNEEMMSDIGNLKRSFLKSYIGHEEPNLLEYLTVKTRSTLIERTAVSDMYAFGMCVLMCFYLFITTRSRFPTYGINEKDHEFMYVIIPKVIYVMMFDPPMDEQPFATLIKDPNWMTTDYNVPSRASQVKLPIVPPKSTSWFRWCREDVCEVVKLELKQKLERKLELEQKERQLERKDRRAESFRISLSPTSPISPTKKQNGGSTDKVQVFKFKRQNAFHFGHGRLIKIRKSRRRTNKKKSRTSKKIK